MLIGSMGSGKSHFGRNLAERKGWQFVDTDRVLESRFGLPIAEIFKKIGEKAFRRAEMDVLKKVCLYHEAVISVGGNFPIEHRTLKVLKKYSYSNVNAFVHAMIQSWKPVYKQCDFVLDTTNGRTYDFIQRIEDELDASDVQFKARRQPNDINDVDAKEASEDIQFNNQQSRKKEISEAVSKRAMSNKIRYDKRYKQKTSNQTNKKGKAHSISKQRTPQGGNGYEKNRNTNKRRRRTWNECRHKSAN